MLSFPLGFSALQTAQMCPVVSTVRCGKCAKRPMLEMRIGVVQLVPDWWL